MPRQRFLRTRNPRALPPWTPAGLFALLVAAATGLTLAVQAASSLLTVVCAVALVTTVGGLTAWVPVGDRRARAAQEAAEAAARWEQFQQAFWDHVEDSDAATGRE